MAWSLQQTRRLQEGNFQAVLAAPKADVEMTVEGKKGSYTATFTNKSDVPAMMIRVKAVDSKTGDLILPVWYSDNYFFIMGGETKTVTINVRDEDCKGKPVIGFEGFNCK